MSHTIRVKKIQMNDMEALQLAVESSPKIHFVSPTGQEVTGIDDATGKHRLYGGNPTGIGIKLPGWKFPVVIDSTTGNISYDNYGGSWGKQDEIDGLAQKYVVEKTRLQAMAMNIQMASEETLDDGSIEMTYNVYDTVGE